MEPISPVVPGLQAAEVLAAENQLEYLTLPILKTSDGQITSRWRFSSEERASIAAGADLYVSLLTFNRGLPPIKLAVIAISAVDPVIDNIVKVMNELGTDSIPFGGTW